MDRIHHHSVTLGTKTHLLVGSELRIEYLLLSLSRHSSFSWDRLVITTTITTGSELRIEYVLLSLSRHGSFSWDHLVITTTQLPVSDRMRLSGSFFQQSNERFENIFADVFRKWFGVLVSYVLQLLPSGFISDKTRGTRDKTLDCPPGCCVNFNV